MTQSIDYFYNKILDIRKMNVKNSTYGGSVIPVIKLYKELTVFEERKSFQEAIEKMLCDKDKKIRRFAVDICIGFFVFRDAI